MRKRVFTILFLVILQLMPIVFAANSQGLSWTVDEGQEIEYTAHVSIDIVEEQLTYKFGDTYQYPAMSMEDTFRFVQTIQSVPELPDELVVEYGVGSYMERPSSEFQLDNGSSIPRWMTPLIPSVDPMFSFEKMVLPVGNWTLINEIYAAHFEDVGPVAHTMINEFNTWGYSRTHHVAGLIDVWEIDATYRFSKSDGIIKRLSITADYGSQGTVDIVLNRNDSPMSMLTLLAVAVGAIAVIAVITVVWKKRFSS